MVVCVVSGRLVTIAALRSPERRCARRPATRPGHRPPRQALAPLLFIGAPRRLWPHRALLAGGPALAASAARCPALRWAAAGFGRLCSVTLLDLAGPLVSSHRRQCRDRPRAPGFRGSRVDVEAAANFSPWQFKRDAPFEQRIKTTEGVLDARDPRPGVEAGLAALGPRRAAIRIDIRRRTTRIQPWPDF